MVDAVVVEGLTKKFNGFTAVDNVSFGVKRGELFGLLGPNGAGKSTITYMLATLLEPTSGSARVNGFDVRSQQDSVRRSIGVVFQDPTVDTRLTAFDNLDIHGRLYGMGARERADRIREVLGLVELTEWGDKLVKTFSGGMRRRLEIARGLLHTPKVLFLDEPTLGLDPQTRRHIWGYINKLKKEGITIILTTHYLEEADYLCDRVAIIDHGRIQVLDSPKNLKRAVGGSVVSMESRAPKKLAGVLVKRGFCEKPRVAGDTVSFETSAGEVVVPKAIEAALKGGVGIRSIQFHVPSLEDVFIHYTGSSIRSEKPAASGFAARRRLRGY